MATTLEIVNQALYKVGEEPITAFPDATTARGRVVTASWPFIRKEVLRLHSWNVATLRTKLIAYAPEPVWDFVAAYTIPSDCLRILEVDTAYPWRVEKGRIVVDGSPSPTLATAVDFTSAPTAANPVVCTITGHSFVDGDVVKITGSLQTEINDRFFLVANAAANTFELTDEDGSGRTTGAGGAAALVTKGDLNVRYIQDLTSGLDGIFDAELESVLALRLAIEIVEKLVNSTTQRQELLNEYGNMLNEAMGDDGEEQSGSEFEEDSWITARY